MHTSEERQRFAAQCLFVASLTRRHLHGNDGGGRNAGLRNRTFHRQDAVDRKCGGHFGDVNLRREPEQDRCVFQDCNASGEALMPASTCPTCTSL